MSDPRSLQETSELPFSHPVELEMYAEEPDAISDDNAMSALDAFPSEAVFPSKAALPAEAEFPPEVFASEAALPSEVALPSEAVSPSEAALPSEAPFSSEAAFPIPPTALDPGNPPPSGASETLTVSLAEVQRAGVAFAWDEAVAIAQSLCRAFLATQLLPRTAYDRMASNAELSLATSEAVFIDAAGHVFVRGRRPRSVEEAIQCVGATLSDMLPVADPLCIGARVVSKAAGSYPTYESLEALSQALTAYEFRDRLGLIGKVFQRATTHPAPETAVTQSTTVPKFTKRPYQLPDVAAMALAAWEQTRTLLSSKALHVVAICAIAACAGGIGGWVLWNWPSQPEVLLIPAAPQVDRSLEKMHLPSAEELRERASLTLAVAAAASRQVNRTDSGVRPAVSNRRPVNQQPLGNVVVDSGATADAPSVASPIVGGLPPAVIAAAPPAASIAPGVERGAVGSTSGKEDRLPIVNRTYDRNSADVIPPSAMYTQLSGILSTESPGIRTEVLTIAVVVNEKGKVNSVKAVTPPRNIGESLVLLGALSAIKSVQFRPAMKDGVPVNYNLIVPVRVPQPIQ